MDESDFHEPFVRPWLSRLMVLAVMALPVALAYLAFALAPLSITCSDVAAEPCETPPVRLFGGLFTFGAQAEIQVLVFVALMGGLGGFAAALGGKGQRVGDGVKAWLRRHLSSTSTGVLVGVAFYTIIRAGAFSPTANLSAINVLGIAVLSLAAGYSAPVVTARLSAMTDRLFEDVGSAKEIASAIQQLDSRIESTLSKPVLDNWIGTVAVVVLASGERQLIPGTKTPSALQPGEPIRCIVHFLGQGDERSDVTYNAFMDRIEIRSGNPEPRSVAFNVALDSPDFEFQTERGTWSSLNPGEALVFDGYAPTEGGNHQLHVMVAQKGRLIQSIMVAVKVPRSDTRRRRLRAE